MKHLKKLLIDHCNPVMRAHYFGVIFDAVPNFLEIKDGTANISQIPGVNELFKLAHDDEASLGDEVTGWNPFLSSLITLAEELEKLGLVYTDGKNNLSSTMLIEIEEVVIL